MEKNVDKIRCEVGLHRLSIALVGPANSIHTQRWANALSDFMKVTVISLKSHIANDGDYAQDVEVYYLPSKGKLSYFLSNRALKSYCHQKKFDLFFTHYASGYGTLLRKSNLRPSILSVWGSDIYDFPNRSIVHKHLLFKNLKYPNLLVSSSHNMTKEIEKKYGIAAGSIPVVPFGVDLNLFSYRKEHQINDKVILGTCKLLEPIYGIEDMLESFLIAHDKLKKMNIDSELRIYGDGSLKEKLEQKAIELKISSNVVFYGWLKHDCLPEEISKMDIFLLSSHHESFGVSAVESMSVGVPVIATQTEGFKEVIENGKSGILVPVRGVEEMGEAIVELVMDPHKRETIALNGRQRVEKLYDWNKNVRTLIRLINMVVDMLHFP